MYGQFGFKVPDAKTFDAWIFYYYFILSNFLFPFCSRYEILTQKKIISIMRK